MFSGSSYTERGELGSVEWRTSWGQGFVVHVQKRSRRRRRRQAMQSETGDHTPDNQLRRRGRRPSSVVVFLWEGPATCDGRRRGRRRRRLKASPSSLASTSCAAFDVRCTTRPDELARVRRAPSKVPLTSYLPKPSSPAALPKAVRPALEPGRLVQVLPSSWFAIWRKSRKPSLSTKGSRPDSGVRAAQVL